MRTYSLAFLFANLLCCLIVKAQTNIPTSATGPSSANPKRLPTYYLEYNKYYLRTLTPVMPTTDSSQVTINALIDNVQATTQYNDYLGRPLQSVIKQASPSRKDYVAPYYFDEFNQNPIHYPTYVQQTDSVNSSSNGKFKVSDFINDSLFYKSLFPNEQIFYSQTNYDASPLGRVVKQLAQGNSWGGASVGVSYSTRANTTADSVRLWTIPITGEDDVPTTSSTYQAGSLFIKQVVDEKGVKALVYVDELGRRIMTKTQLATSPTTGHTGWLCTYYVYDEMNNLRMVIPPKAVEALNNVTANWNLVTNSNINSGLCYRYYYDGRGRVIMKYIPGKGKSYIAYDLFDRIVMFQDPNLRLTNQWEFVLYDGQNRKTQTGLITATLIKDSIIAQAARSTNYPTLSGTYTIVSQTYYDDYSWTSGTPLSSTLDGSHINSSNFNTAYNTSPQYAQPISLSNRIRGTVTGIKKLIIGTSTYVYSLMLYDDHIRAIQIKQTNYTAGIDILTTQYSFDSKILRTHLQHQKSGANSQTHTLLTKYSYDHVGRLRTIIKNIDSTSDKTVSTIGYNELGQVQTDTLGTNFTRQQYVYNIRGWLLGINKGFVDSSGSTTAYFGEDLFYDYGFTNSQLNGSIAGIKWKTTGDNISRAYGFTYDNANRLTIADFSQQNSGSSSWTKDKIDYTVDGLSYDASSNILTMRQRGINIGSPLTIDSLSYQYLTNSNQLQNVSDGISNASPLGDFKDTLISGVNDYSYDANGNIVKDYNRKMYTTSNGNGSVYNFLDKPDSIVTLGKSTVYYYYDASGLMLSKKINDYSSGTLKSKTYLYLNGFVYLNDTLQYVLQEEGRIRYRSDSSKFVYDYFLKDHLQNVRTVLTEQPKQDAYPAATMELVDSTINNTYYSNINLTRSNVPTGYPIDTSYSKPNQYVAKVNGSGNKIGPAIILKVMAGDQFNVQVKSWYYKNGIAPGTPYNPVTDIINALTNSIGTVGGSKATTSQLSSSGVLNPGAISYYSSHGGDSITKPKAYLNWVVFDEQFNYVSSSSGFQQVGNDNTLTTLGSNGLPITNNGYLYIYVSNETPNIDVFFDNLQVTHIRGPLLQEQAYYPFGLQMAGISSQALNFDKFTNSYKFNSGDELEESINLYSTYYRGYDPQLGRFNGIDILGESTFDFSPYHFSANNPISFSDPSGAKYMDANGNVWHHADPFAGIPGLEGTPAIDGFGSDGFGDMSYGGGGSGGSGGDYSAFWQNFLDLNWNRVSPDGHEGPLSINFVQGANGRIGYWGPDNIPHGDDEVVVGTKFYEFDGNSSPGKVFQILDGNYRWFPYGFKQQVAVIFGLYLYIEPDPPNERGDVSMTFRYSQVSVIAPDKTKPKEASEDFNLAWNYAVERINKELNADMYPKPFENIIKPIFEGYLIDRAKSFGLQVMLNTVPYNVNTDDAHISWATFKPK